MRATVVRELPLQSEVCRVIDIESALQKIDEIASYHEGVAAEEALILRGLATILIYSRTPADVVYSDLSRISSAHTQKCSSE